MHREMMLMTIKRVLATWKNSFIIRLNLSESELDTLKRQNEALTAIEFGTCNREGR